MTLAENLDAMGILACNRNPYLPSLDDFGFAWGEMTALIDRKALFLSKFFRHRTVYLAPRVYFLLRQCRPRRPMPPDAASLYGILENSPPLETGEWKQLSLLDHTRYQKAFQFLLEQRYATALANGSVLNPNWSTLKYGTAEAWEACSVSPPPSRDPEEELRAILGRTLPEGEVARLLRGA